MNELCFVTNLSSGDVAAWAQAVVSTLAIGTGAAAVYWQVRRQRRDALHTAWESQRDRALSLVDLLAFAHMRLLHAQTCMTSREAAEAYFLNQYELTGWFDLQEELTELDLNPLGLPHISLRVRGARRAIASAVEAMQSLASQPMMLAALRFERAETDLNVALDSTNATMVALQRVTSELSQRLNG